MKIFPYWPIGFMFFLTACAVSRPLTIRENKVVSEHLYEFSNPGEGWIFQKKNKFSHAQRGSTIMDGYFVNCPNSEVIVVSRAVYKTAEFSDALKVAKAYVDSYYRSMHKPPNAVFKGGKNIVVNGYEAVELIYETVEKNYVCPNQDTTDTEVFYRFILIKGGDASAFSGWGKNSPKWIVFWYAAPKEKTDHMNDFVVLLQSFRYLN